MQGLAILFIVVGFGSIVLPSLTDRQFVWLMWADDYQPIIGIVVGVVGVALLVANILRAKSKAQQAPAAQEAPEQSGR